MTTKDVGRMTIYWVRAASDEPLDMLEAVDRALVNGDTGTPPAPPPAAERDPFAGDTYLVENLELARQSWSVDYRRIAVSRLPGVGVLLNRVQSLVRRATAWYSRSQWEQVTAFHGASVRIIDSLLAHQRQLYTRIQALEDRQTMVHIESIEQQLASLRRERVELLARISSLEQQAVGGTQKADG